MSILIISTGGTIDKVYDPITQELCFKNYSPAIESSSCLINDQEVMIMPQIDSREMDNKYRKKLLNVIRESYSDKILILHGTDTIVKTAEYLERNLPCRYSVILTGSYVPASIDMISAIFNIGMSLGILNQLTEEVLNPIHPNVGICINGELYGAHNCFKNKKTGLIERK